MDGLVSTSPSISHRQEDRSAWNNIYFDVAEVQKWTQKVGESHCVSSKYTAWAMDMRVVEFVRPKRRFIQNEEGIKKEW